MFICCFPCAEGLENAAAVELEVTEPWIRLESARLFFLGLQRLMRCIEPSVVEDGAFVISLEVWPLFA